MFYLGENYNSFYFPPYTFTDPPLKRPVSFKGRVELGPFLVLDLKCKLLDVQCCDWLSPFFGRHCVPIGAVT